MCWFGKRATIDRMEIEDYNAIRKLMVEFLASTRVSRPLCLAVYGPPGSGKSFAVKQTVRSIPGGDVESVTYNVSQFESYEDLVSALHDVRDIALSGKVPFVFFDEFDSALGDERLGWLKYFLAPMQDGEFKDGPTVHPIGKAIFAFAGGTRSSFEEFGEYMSDVEPADDRQKALAAEFRNAKGPDFVSRLRGFINVMGPNRQPRGEYEDQTYVIRRAMLLRAALRREATAAGLFKPGGEVRIDDGVLRALLYVSKYRHGVRSISALLEMSLLAGKRRFDQAGLPPREQLGLHVDADEFYFLMKRERFHTMLRPGDWYEPAAETLVASERSLVEDVAATIHEDYCAFMAPKAKKGAGSPDDSAVRPYADLPEELKQSNVDAAEDIPHKLRQLNCGLRKVQADQKVKLISFSDTEVESLAELEHRRWFRHRQMHRYSYGPRKSYSKRTSPAMVPYRKLPKAVKGIDRAAVKAIPRILAALGYEVYRLGQNGR